MGSTYIFLSDASTPWDVSSYRHIAILHINDDGSATQVEGLAGDANFSGVTNWGINTTNSENGDLILRVENFSAAYMNSPEIQAGLASIPLAHISDDNSVWESILDEAESWGPEVAVPGATEDQKFYSSSTPYDLHSSNSNAAANTLLDKAGIDLREKNPDGTYKYYPDGWNPTNTMGSNNIIDEAGDSAYDIESGKGKVIHTGGGGTNTINVEKGGFVAIDSHDPNGTIDIINLKGVDSDDISLLRQGDDLYVFDKSSGTPRVVAIIKDHFGEDGSSLDQITFSADQNSNGGEGDPIEFDHATSMPTSTDHEVPNSIFEDVAEWIQWAWDAFWAAWNNGSPLVFDLDGDGIELVSLANSNVYWDIDQDGFGEAIGWVQADDGFLAIDANNDGIITDHSELFGSVAEDGFTDLRLLDSNSDNMMNASDAAFADLLVWRDLNQNGVSEANELFTLAALDIVSINLNATAVNQTNQGHDISHVSTYTMDDGVSGPQTLSIVDVWFQYDDINTSFVGEYELDLASLFTVNQRGYGTLPDLYVAASMDNDLNDPDSLLSLLTAFSGKTLDELFVDDGSVLAEVQDILFRWAGVDDVDPASRGAHIDARKLEFLEELFGQEFLQQGFIENPGGGAGDQLDEAFDIALDALAARLTAQAAGQSLFAGSPFYNPVTDSLDGVTGLIQDTLDILLDRSQDASQVSDKVAFWKGVVNVIDQLVGVANLSTADQTALETSIVTSDATLSTAQILDALEWQSEVGDVMGGTTGNDTLTGTVGNDNITAGNGNDTLYGGIGDDTLSGDNNDDILYGQSGNDYLVGGGGADTYKYVAGQGDDVIVEENTQIDTLEFTSAAVTLADLTIVRVPSAGLLITLDTDVGGGSVRISSGNVEILKFADASTFDLRTMNQTLIGTDANETLFGMLAGSMGTGTDYIYGMGGNDIINVDAANETDSVVNYAYGGDGDDDINGDTGNDQLWGDAGNDDIYGAQGNDTLTGGTGDDYVRGYQGDDIYVFNLGDGNDTYFEGGGADKILFGAGIAQADLSIYRISNRDVKIDISGGAGGSIVLQDQTYGTGQNYVTETLQFHDGSTLNLTTYDLTLNGTSAGETLSGVKVGGSGVDTIYGHGGNDIIYGYAGSFDTLANTLYGGDGDDTIHGANGVDTIAGDAGNDTLYGYDGNDVIHGGAGNDTIGGGDNNDTIYGDDGADNLTGGNNNDTLIGGLGADTLTGSGGNDIFKFLSGQSLDAVDSITDFNTTYDKIDVADLIDFDPLTHVITDFVQITTSGANSNLAVDTDGGGNNFIQIAVILNKTGLTDEAALLAGGQLLAA